MCKECSRLKRLVDHKDTQIGNLLDVMRLSIGCAEKRGTLCESCKRRMRQIAKAVERD